ncbi:MAG: VWA domain-containing protein [Actinomycetota bacterium]
MSFLSPWWLLLLAVPLLVGLVYVVAQRQRRGYAIRLADLQLLDDVVPDRPGWRRHVPAVLLCVALTALAVGLARPSLDRTVPDDRSTVILAIDTSLSMGATDVDPDRLSAAKDAATVFLDELPDEVRVGLVSFSGTAVSVLSPTRDHELVAAAVSGLGLGEGTAIGEAVFTGLGMVEELREATEEEVPATIVVLSDGETTQGRPDEQAVDAATDAGVAVSTIAFGTEDGIVTLPDGSQEPVPVNARALEAIAERGEGAFFEALTFDELRDAFDDLGSSVGRRTEAREIGRWFVVGGLVVAGLAALGSIRWFARIP